MTVTITNLTVPFWRQGKRRPKDLPNILQCVSNRVRVANSSQVRTFSSEDWSVTFLGGQILPVGRHLVKVWDHEGHEVSSLEVLSGCPDL